MESAASRNHLEFPLSLRQELSECLLFVLSDLKLVEIQILSKRDVGLEEIKHHLGRGIEVCIDSHKKLLMRGQDILGRVSLNQPWKKETRESSIKGSAPLVASDYESAGLIHDLNHPVSSELHERFDVVIKAGSLEHVFNFPIAVGNLMRMLPAGGFMYLTVPANNLFGHGFYQFSPELMFRIFTPDNGFELKRVMLAEARFPGTELASARGVYEVADPARFGSRVELFSRRPAILW